MKLHWHDTVEIASEAPVTYHRLLVVKLDAMMSRELNLHNGPCLKIRSFRQHLEGSSDQRDPTKADWITGIFAIDYSYQEFASRNVIVHLNVKVGMRAKSEHIFNSIVQKSDLHCPPSPTA